MHADDGQENRNKSLNLGLELVRCTKRGIARNQPNYYICKYVSNFAHSLSSAIPCRYKLSKEACRLNEVRKIN